MKLNKKIVIGASLIGLTVAAVISVLASATFAPASQPVGYVGQPVPSSINVTDGKAKLYTIDYDARVWSGNLHSYPISATGMVSTTDDWGVGGASAKIKAQIKLGARYIVTYDYTTSAGTPFLWGSLPNLYKQAIDSGAATASATSSNILDYLRGDPANEGTGAGKLRARGYGLGDIIHSTPMYWDDGTNKTVFVGANDGMLHAINAADGNERFAFVPASVIADVSKLASQAYTHQYFVDGRMDIKKFGTQTILVGTTGAGGKGIFGLDVTNAAPASETDAAAKVLWEVNNLSTGFANLGNTYSAPSLAILPDGSKAVVVGNGYNNGGNGHAVLYLINAVTGALIKEFDTGSGSSTSPNGLSSPSLWDSDGDGVKDTAYAGDIDGNVWKFKLTAGYTTVPVKLYTNTAGANQAITMAPGLMAHPLGGVMVEFVTGRQLTTDDSAVKDTYYAYGLWDGAPAANDTFLSQTLTEATYTSGTTISTRVRTATANVPNWTAGTGHHKGWRTALPIGGERVVGDGAYVNGAVFQFFSTNPTINPTSIPPGENWWMQLNPLTGGDTGVVLFDLNEDKSFSDLDKVTVATVAKAPVGRFMGGGIRSQLVALSAGGVDVFQSNYDRNAAPPVPTITQTSRTVSGDRGVSGGHFDTDVFCYTNCGKASSGYQVLANPWGAAAYGYESGGATDTQRYIHVHEYDDIFDRIGLNMLHPSQDTQRLTLTQASTTVKTSSPDTPTLESNNQYPASSVIVGSPITTSGFKTGNNGTPPATTYSYVDSAETGVANSFSLTTSGTNIVVTSQTQYTTDVTITESVDIGAVVSKKTPYSQKKTVRRWTTVVTRVVTSPNSSFKILMANQAYSPAVTFRIDGSDTPTKTNATYADSVYKYQASNNLKVADLPTYKMSAISELTFAMPLDAFNIKDWGTGITRTGVHPIRPQCAGVAANAPTLGPNGEWRNGALTVQIVDSSITDNDIQQNGNNNNNAKLGYRLKDSSLKTKLIAEYLIYWHHPSQTCMADTNWSMKPAQDTSTSTAIQGFYPAAENDPRGVFVPGSGAGTDVVVPPTPDPVVVTALDGTKTTTTVSYTPLAGGGYTETTTVRTDPPVSSTDTGIVTGGSVDLTGNIGAGIPIKAGALGRINWRELQR